LRMGNDFRTSCIDAVSIVPNGDYFTEVNRRLLPSLFGGDNVSRER
jgi:hypothetical protein